MRFRGYFFAGSLLLFSGRALSVPFVHGICPVLGLPDLIGNFLYSLASLFLLEPVGRRCHTAAFISTPESVLELRKRCHTPLKSPDITAGDQIHIARPVVIALNVALFRFSRSLSVFGKECCDGFVRFFPYLNKPLCSHACLPTIR